MTTTAYPAYSTIEVEPLDDPSGVVRLTLNRPAQLNALSAELLDEFFDAIERFDKALALDEGYAPAWFGKARVLFNGGRKKEGKQAAQQFLKLADPADSKAQTLRKLLGEE